MPKTVSPKRILDEYLKLLDILVRFLTPNSIPSDLDYIESKLAHHSDNYKRFSAIHADIWLHWENLVMSNLKPNILKGYFTRYFNSFIFSYNEFLKYYNDATFKEAKSTVSLYKTDKCYQLISSMQGILQNDYYEFQRFEKLYDIKRTDLTKSKIKPAQLNFQYKDFDDQILRQIFQGLTKCLNGFIAGDEKAEDRFVAFFTTSDITLIEDQLQILCDNPQFHYILKRMQPLFRQSLLTGIDKAAKLTSKQGTLLTANSISKAGSKQPDPKKRSSIDKVFGNLKG